MTIELTGRSILFEGKPVNGRYPAVAAANSNPSGGTDALGWEAIDGDLNNGSTIRITTDGTYDFGSKITQNPVAWDMGEDLRINGMPNSAHADASDGTDVTTAGVLTGSTAAITTTRPNRHPNINRHYNSAAGNFQSKVFYDDVLDTASASRKYYSAFRLKMPVDPRYIDGAPYSSLVGSFDTGNVGELGEAITLNTGGTDYQGNVISIDSPTAGYLYVYSPEIALNSEDGVVSITGNSSGATCDIDFSSGYESTPDSKLWRINQEQNDGVLAVVQIANETFWIESNSAGTDEVGMSRGANAPDWDVAVSDGEWAFCELYVDWSVSTNLKAYLRIIGSKGQDVKEITGIDGSTNYLDVPVKILMMGLDTNVDFNLNVDWGEAIADETPQRVAIGNANTYAACTDVEVFYTESWASSQIDAEIYAGASGGLSGKYLYWFDADNNPALVGQL